MHPTAYLRHMLSMPLRYLLAALLAFSPPAAAQLFDNHVHLHDGEASVRAYEAQTRRDGLSVRAYAAMWFGGPHQALAGDVAAIRRGNDAIVALAKRHPALVPVATVHPYDGDAALAELARVAKLGCGC